MDATAAVGRDLRRSLLRLAVVAAVCLTAADAATEVVNTKLDGISRTVVSYRVSLDSLWVVYQIDHPDGYLVLAAPAEGGVRATLGGFLNSYPDYYEISPDSAHVVYYYEGSCMSIWNVPIQGPTTASVKLAPHPPLCSVSLFAHTPDSNHVVYVARDPTNSSVNLYRVPATGPAAAVEPLTDEIEGSTVSVSSSEILTLPEVTPDGTSLVFYASQWILGEEVFSLYSVPVAGPATEAVRITDRLGIDLDTPPNQDEPFYSFKITPDSSRVVFVADLEVQTLFEIFSVPVIGPPGETVRLNTHPHALGDIMDFEISPDGGRVVYRGDRDTDEQFELYSVPIAGHGTGEVKLNKDLPVGGNVGTFQISPDGGSVVYMADQDADDVWELYRVPILGPATSGTKLTDAPTSGGNVLEFQISPDGAHAVYIADLQVNDRFELYSIPLAGQPSDRVTLNRPLGFEGDVVDYEISPDGKWVAYRADPSRGTGVYDEMFRLFRVPIGGPGLASIQFNGSMVEDGDVTPQYAFTPDSARIVYIADQDTNDVFELYVSYIPPAIARRWEVYR